MSKDPDKRCESKESEEAFLKRVKTIGELTSIGLLVLGFVLGVLPIVIIGSLGFIGFSDWNIDGSISEHDYDFDYSSSHHSSGGFGSGHGGGGHSSGGGAGRGR